MRGLQLFWAYLLCDWVATIGAVLATASAAVFLGSAFHAFSNPYYGIIVFIALPAFFLTGLILVPIGVWRCSRRAGGFRNIQLAQATPSRALGLYGLIALLTVANVAIFSAASYNGVKYIDSNEFCGTVCHTVMTPQYTAYRNSPHSRVPCVDCHIGPGAESFLQYKLSAIRQVVAATFDTYHRPLPPAIRSLRPSQDTCEHCHWPDKLHADKLKVIRRYADDEKNTEKVTVLLMRIGSKVHKAHVGSEIEYVATDVGHQDIPWVSVGGEVFKSNDALGERRKMDCIDCHNRPTHAFETPGPAIDRALESGQLDRSIPYAKRDAVLALTGKLPLEKAPEAVQRIHARNIFPRMNVSWGTYPSNIGHEQFPGCFRCHDENHKTDAGKTISQDCGICHELLAVEEENPEILTQLGIMKPADERPEF